jgi:hypothetical protein
MDNKITSRHAGWPRLFRIRGSRHRSGVREFWRYMKASAITSAFGVFMLILCVLCGVVSAFVMCGLGMCGWVPLDLGACLFAVFTALSPAATVSFLRAPWWLSSLAFSVLMLIPVIVGFVSEHWLRAIVSVNAIVSPKFAL